MTDKLPATIKGNSALVSFEDLGRLARTVYESKLFPSLTNVNQAFTLMMLCQSEGIHPIQAMRRYDIVKGRPALKAGSMLADFKKIGGVYKILERTDLACKIHFKQGDIEDTVSWTMEDAHKAGLTGKDVWKNYPRAMLFARAVSEGIRIVAPEINLGVYTPEEVMDFDTFDDDGSKARAEEKKQYDLIMEVITSTVDDITDAESANDFMNGVASYDHVGDSKTQAARALKKKAESLGLTFDRENTCYSNPEVSKDGTEDAPDSPPVDAEDAEIVDVVETAPEEKPPTQAAIKKEFNRLCKACRDEPTMENMNAVDDFWNLHESLQTDKNGEKLLILQHDIDEKNKETSK